MEEKIARLSDTVEVKLSKSIRDSIRIIEDSNNLIFFSGKEKAFFTCAF